ncbi:hypothetical protein RRG08_059854 [Elysia crispata]|uniref:Uncharacterized protein n=1 Tax=Elysia crispata TaxID=231223 RepID=A0AAE1AAF8_9GAST|nr:hypothetical protein RRG08_059854 [Elysia crispata]
MFLCSARTQCEDGWFGPDCQYQCHCAGSAPCNKHDGSCSSGCHQDWFGPACQYASVAFNVTFRQKNVSWLADKDDMTCNNGKTIRLRIKTQVPIHLSWIRAVFKDTAKNKQIYLKKIEQGKKQRLICQSTALVNKTTYDIVCKTQKSAKKYVLFGSGVKSLCSIYISGGRNLALKQNTKQSSTFKPCFSSHAVDGKLDNIASQAATCTRTGKGDTGWWRLTFSQPVHVYMFRIYNIRKPERKSKSSLQLL